MSFFLPCHLVTWQPPSLPPTLPEIKILNQMPNKIKLGQNFKKNFGSKITSGFHWIKAQVKVTRFLYKSVHVSLDGFVTSISTYRESESYEYFPSELAGTYNSFVSKFFFFHFYDTIFIYESVELRNVHLTRNSIPSMSSLSLLYLTSNLFLSVFICLHLQS